MSSYVAYYRVSTAQQGKSGLGLDAQKSIVSDYVTKHNGTIISEYSEIQTGTSKKRRIEVYKAISEARKKKATLIVAKLDRLARDYDFISAVMKMDIDIVFVDFPAANKFVIGIIGLVAEYEAGLISQRTKDALQALKAKGVKLGNPRIRDIVRKPREPQTEQTANKIAIGLILDYKKSGKTFAQIAEILNDANLRTTTKKEFTPDNVRMIYNGATKKSLV